MRRQSILFAAILSVCVFHDSLWARPIVALEAEMAVKSWLRIDSHPLGYTLGREVRSVETFNNDDGEPLYHIVYLEPQGFVIVAGNDSVEPIIGFADDGIYDPSCDDPFGALVTNDIKTRTSTLKNRMVLSIQHSAEPPVRAQRKWIDLLSLSQIITDRERVMAVSDSGLDYLSEIRVGPLVKSIWAQGGRCGQFCYNYYTPNHYPCGCVALSMAQVMHYHRHPSEGIGCQESHIRVDGLTKDVFTRGGDGDGEPYKWGLMPDYPSCATSEEQCEAIGALCYDAGLAVHTSYNPNSSTASGIVRALREIFGYGNAVHTHRFENAEDAINSNLDAGYPVGLTIYSTMGSSHAIICDGYGYSASTQYHHLGLGHYGTDDAWYNLYDLDVPRINGGSFQAVTGIEYNIMPSGAGEVISGRVTNGAGYPIPWATVTAEGSGGPYVATTNTRGIYALVHVQSETDYVVSVQKQGYSFSSRNVHTGESMQSSAPGNRWGIDFVGFQGGDAEVDFEAGNFAGFEWEHDGDADWDIVSDLAHCGRYSAQAGFIDGDDQSILRLKVDCVAGQITFWYKTSSESGYDWLRFYIDGVEKDAWSGECDWTNASFPVDVGTRTFEWIYAKDGSVSDGSDTSWIDNITLPVSGSGLMVIDDFETYNDNDNRIWDAWIDGRDNPQNGAIVGYGGPNLVQREHAAETVIVYDGRQAMPYFYDTRFESTEATMRMSSLHDWTVQGIETMSLWFRSHSPPAGKFVFTGGPGNGYEMTAAGADIGNRADECHYAYKRLRGPGGIEVRVEKIENIHEWAKAGVMIRETLDPGSKFAGVFVTAGHGCIFQARMEADVDAKSDTLLATSQQQAMSENTWLKLERNENGDVSGYYSEVAPFHNAWQPMPWNPLHIPMADDVYIGMAVTSHDPYRTAQAIFTWPKTYGDDDPVWSSRDIGIIRNVPAPMYVAVTDSAGWSASVFHNDPRAVLTDKWSQWTIDLREFASRGVDLVDVESLSIGFGSGEMIPESGAAGLVFFDNIHLESILGDLPSINLQATPGPACIDLTWSQYDFELFAGFSLYRATEPEPSGVFTRLNPTILATDQNSFRDADVQPNTTYYYKCAVVTTDMAEPDYSSMVSAMPLDVNPPQIQHEPITSAEPGSSLTFWAEVADETSVDSVSLFFRRIGQTEYQKRSMVLIYHNRYSVTLEGEWNQVPGLEYYIEATDGLSTATSGSAVSPHCLANMPLEGQEDAEPGVIGNWEHRMDGWDQADWSDTTFSYNDTVGVTRGNYSLEAHVPQSGWKDIMQIDLVQVGRVQEFARNNTISLDVTRLTGDWSTVPTPQRCDVRIWMNAEGVGWNLSEPLGAAAPWRPDDGDVTQTAVWSYAEHLPQIDFDRLSCLKLRVISTCDEDYPGEVILYLDNMQLIED